MLRSPCLVVSLLLNRQVFQSLIGNQSTSWKKTCTLIDEIINDDNDYHYRSSLSPNYCLALCWGCLAEIRGAIAFMLQ